MKDKDGLFLEKGDRVNFYYVRAEKTGYIDATIILVHEKMAFAF
jgi:hypothetical protein